MGYTHYYDINIDKYEANMYEELLIQIKDLVRYNQMHGLQSYITGWDGDIRTRPEWTEERIAFNGVYPHDCETFSVEANPTAPDWYDEAGWDKKIVHYFCKTRQLGYDALVCATLLLMNDIYGEAISIHSDGSWDDWAAGAKMYEAVLGRPAKCPF